MQQLYGRALDTGRPSLFEQAREVFFDELARYEMRASPEWTNQSFIVPAAED